jgi:maltose-binding protein MalE
MPIRKDSLQSQTVTSGDRAEFFKAVQGSLEHGDAFPVVPKLFEIIDEVNKMQQAIGQGQDPAAALAAAQGKLEDICGNSCVVPDSK